MIFLRIAAAVIFSILVVTSAIAHEYKTGDLLIDHPHMTQPLPGVKVSAGYLVITNNGTEDERLVGVSSQFAEKNQVHSVEMVDGVAKMRPVEGGIAIPPGHSVKLKKGGFHLMFMKVSDDLEAGQLRPVKLHFEKAGTIEVEMVVVDPADLDNGDGEMDHSSHGEGDHSGHSE